MSEQLSLFDYHPMSREEAQASIQAMIWSGKLGRDCYGFSGDRNAVGLLSYNQQQTDDFINLARAAGCVLAENNVYDRNGGGSIYIKLPFEVDWKVIEAEHKRAKKEHWEAMRQKYPQYFKPNGALDIFKLVYIKGWPVPEGMKQE